MIVFYPLLLFFLYQGTSLCYRLPTIQVRVRRWLSESQRPEVPGSEGLLEGPKVGVLDVYAADDKRKGDRDL